jgi:hypothetical protein
MRILMSTSEPNDLPPLEASFAVALAEKISGSIKMANEQSPGKPASVTCKKLVSKRIPPSMIAQFECLDGYHLLVYDEIMSVMDRIIVYPTIAKYRKHLLHAPREVLRAWQFHSHSLRVSELYIIQDRTVALLEFVNVVAIETGIPATDCRKSFESSFKKVFGQRLRERHRLTHAHERPSLTSRVIELSSVKWVGETEMAKDLLIELLDMLIPLYVEASHAAGHKPPANLSDIEEQYESIAILEARQMLKIIEEVLYDTIRVPKTSII